MHERMRAGELYIPDDPVTAASRRAQSVMEAFNRTAFDDDGRGR